MKHQYNSKMHYSKISGRNSIETEPQNSSNIFFRLRDLDEVEDESRVEQCPIFADQQSVSNEFQGDASLTKKDSLLKELQEQSFTQQQTGKLHSGVDQLESRSRCVIKGSSTGVQMHQVNQKLMQDNQKLFQEVIRLRKIVDSQTHPFFRRKLQKSHQKLPYHNSLTIENQKLKIQNQTICQKLQKITLKLIEKEDTIEKLSSSNRIIPIIEKENGILLDKILLIQKEFQQKIERMTVKSSQSSQNNSTIFDSKKPEGQKDRMITNMKVVYESQVKKLKIIIQNQKKEIAQKNQ